MNNDMDPLSDEVNQAFNAFKQDGVLRSKPPERRNDQLVSYDSTSS